VMTLGRGSAGTGAGTAGPAAGLYTTQSQTGLDNNGYGSITGGTRPSDSDDDGMSDDWENANGSDPGADDAMTKAPDGYALIEHTLNWLAEPHAATRVGVAVDVDLTAYAAGFAAVSPTFTLSDAQNGAVSLLPDGHTAHLEPSSGCYGLASFTFTVTGSESSAYSDEVVVLVAP
jgi:hypothetical protein